MNIKDTNGLLSLAATLTPAALWLAQESSCALATTLMDEHQCQALCRMQGGPKLPQVPASHVAFSRVVLQSALGSSQPHKCRQM
jgi:hypothetical protein